MNRSFLIFLAVGVAILVSGATVCTAIEYPHPKVAYKADFTMTFEMPGGQSRTMKGKIFSTKGKVGKERREMVNMGRKVIYIDDALKDEEYTLMPDRKAYMVHTGDKGRDKNPAQMIRDGNMSITRVGTGRANGRSVIKYQFKSTGSEGETFFGYAWLTKKNIPVRFVGTATENGVKHKIKIDYFNIVEGGHDPKLFRVPANYTLIPTGVGNMTSAPGMTPNPDTSQRRRRSLNPGGNPGQGMNPAMGMTPEQLEQVTRGMTPEQRKQFEQMIKTMQNQQGNQ